jgi:MerR family transcriptional regulator, light-induced transcriptional regulator
MVYIRNKKVKGIDYAYLVQSVWDTKRNMSRQQTIKYLGKASQITIEDIPEEYRDNTKIQAFVAAFSSYQEERKTLVSKIQEEMFALLTDCNVIALVDIYKKYSRLFGLIELYDKLLKPVMYRIGDLWQQGQLDVALLLQLYKMSHQHFQNIIYILRSLCTILPAKYWETKIITLLF